MKSKKLLNHLSDLEATLSDFSFEELTTEEANALKKSFHSFKSSLEDKVAGDSYPTAYQNNPDYQKKINEAVKKDTLKTKLQKKNTAKESQLIATVSHEIRTPLNGIIGFTDLLKESKLTPKQLNQVNAIQSASDTLLDIINELLEFSKLSAGQEKVETISFNFYNVIRNTIYLCNTLILDKKVKLKVNMDPDIPEHLIGDPSKLSQILLNLLGNAIKFIEKGDISLNISLFKEKGGLLQLEFDIIDTGIGIQKEKLAHIFNPYEQAEHDTYLKYGGTGLGLSIVKQIVEHLKGKISVSSVLGSGTTFKFILPFKKSTSKVQQKTKITPTNYDTKKALVKDMRILVFEDNPLNQKLIQNRLESWGCSTFVTDDADHGINILENNRVDVVLMDLRMPKMNGFQVTQKIRTHKNVTVRNIHIVALTADFSIIDLEQCNTCGINDYLLKPYSSDDLLDKLTFKNNKIIEPIGIHSKNNTANNPREINLDPILEDCMGDLNLLEELVGLYKKNALEFIGKVKLALQNTDFKELEAAAHKIKTGLTMMQTYDLHEIVVQMQKTCLSDKDVNHLEFLYTCFLKEYPIVEKSIDEKLKTLQRK